MDLTEEKKLFEDEKLVIISSTDEIDMTQWRNHLIKNWDKVGLIFHSAPFTPNCQNQCWNMDLLELVSLECVFNSMSELHTD